MEKNDILIVQQLREDARKPVLRIGKTVRLCRATVTKRLQQLQERIIRKYTALVDFRQFGFAVRLLFSITLAEEDRDVFCRYIQGHACLNNLYTAVDGADYIVEMIFRSRSEAEGFLAGLEKAFLIVDKSVFFVDDDVVRESFSPVGMPL